MRGLRGRHPASVPQRWAVLPLVALAAWLCLAQPVPAQEPTPTPLDDATTYTIKPGDTMLGIAARLGVRYDDLLAANPQITDPRLIHPGTRLQIGGRGALSLPAVVLAMDSAPGGWVRLLAGGLWHREQVVVEWGRVGAEPARIELAIATERGMLSKRLDIPTFARPGEHWQATVRTRRAGQPELDASTAPITIGEGAGPGALAAGISLGALVAPSSALPGEQVLLVAWGLPPGELVRVGIALAGEAPRVTRPARADDEGWLLATVHLPRRAAAGERWSVSLRPAPGAAIEGTLAAELTVRGAP